MKEAFYHSVLPILFIKLLPILLIGVLLFPQTSQSLYSPAKVKTARRHQRPARSHLADAVNYNRMKAAW